MDRPVQHVLIDIRLRLCNNRYINEERTGLMSKYNEDEIQQIMGAHGFTREQAIEIIKDMEIERQWELRMFREGRL